ncbi:unnamed protein product [Amoebophrya sp. A120]|nr:unnamed protein product [Amoebophrya sp. A120]|eukprot:GSA120T00009709001.1
MPTSPKRNKESSAKNHSEHQANMALLHANRNIIPSDGLENEAIPDDIRLFDFLTIEREQQWLAQQRGETIANTKAFMTAKGLSSSLALGLFPTKKSLLLASSSKTLENSAENANEKEPTENADNGTKPATTTAVADSSSKPPKPLLSRSSTLETTASGTTNSDPLQASSSSKTSEDKDTTAQEVDKNNKNLMQNISVEQLMKEIQVESQQQAEAKKQKKREKDLPPDPSDELDEGSDSNPSGDNLSPEKLRKMREKMGSRGEGRSNSSSPNKIKRTSTGNRGNGSSSFNRGGHFHGIMRHYLQVRNLFNAKEDLALRQQKMSLLNRIVAFGRTTYIAKNSGGAAPGGTNNSPLTGVLGTSVSMPSLLSQTGGPFGGAGGSTHGVEELVDLFNEHNITADDLAQAGRVNGGSNSPLLQSKINSLIQSHEHQSLAATAGDFFRRDNGTDLSNALAGAAVVAEGAGVGLNNNNPGTTAAGGLANASNSSPIIVQPAAETGSRWNLPQMGGGANGTSRRSSSGAIKTSSNYGQSPKKTKKRKKWVSPVIETAMKFLHNTTGDGGDADGLNVGDNNRDPHDKAGATGTNNKDRDSQNNGSLLVSKMNAAPGGSSTTNNTSAAAEVAPLGQKKEDLLEALLEQANRGPGMPVNLNATGAPPAATSSNNAGAPGATTTTSSSKSAAASNALAVANGIVEQLDGLLSVFSLKENNQNIRGTTTSADDNNINTTTSATTAAEDEQSAAVEVAKKSPDTTTSATSASAGASTYENYLKQAPTTVQIVNVEFPFAQQAPAVNVAAATGGSSIAVSNFNSGNHVPTASLHTTTSKVRSSSKSTSPEDNTVTTSRKTSKNKQSVDQAIDMANKIARDLLLETNTSSNSANNSVAEQQQSSVSLSLSGVVEQVICEQETSGAISGTTGGSSNASSKRVTPQNAAGPQNLSTSGTTTVVSSTGGLQQHATTVNGTKPPASRSLSLTSLVSGAGGPPGGPSTSSSNSNSQHEQQQLEASTHHQSWYAKSSAPLIEQRERAAQMQANLNHHQREALGGSTGTGGYYTQSSSALTNLTSSKIVHSASTSLNDLHHSSTHTTLRTMWSTMGAGAQPLPHVRQPGQPVSKLVSNSTGASWLQTAQHDDGMLLSALRRALTGSGIDGNGESNVGTTSNGQMLSQHLHQQGVVSSHNYQPGGSATSLGPPHQHHQPGSVSTNAARTGRLFHQHSGLAQSGHVSVHPHAVLAHQMQQVQHQVAGAHQHQHHPAHHAVHPHAQMTTTRSALQTNLNATIGSSTTGLSNSGRMIVNHTNSSPRNPNRAVMQQKTWYNSSPRAAPGGGATAGGTTTGPNHSVGAGTGKELFK